MKITEFIAKSNSNSLNHLLVDHTKMVINFGMALGDLIYKEDNETERQNFFSNLALSLSLHDIGKIHPKVQNFLKNCKDNPYNSDDVEQTYTTRNKHYAYSWAYAMSKIGVLYSFDWIAAPILLHHNRNYTPNDKTVRDIMSELDEDTLNNMDAFFNEMTSYCQDTFKGLGVDFSDFSIKSKPLPTNHKVEDVKLYGKIEINSDSNIKELFKNEAQMQLIRAILIQADRLVSSSMCMQEKVDLDKVYNNDTEYIKELYDKMRQSNYQGPTLPSTINQYDPVRLNSQLEILAGCYCHNHNVIKACAGFGKTLIGLLWFLEQKKRTIWVVPRNIIAKGIYKSILKEVKKMNLTINVGLYVGGKIRSKNCDITNLDEFDILITNIDSVVNRTANNSQAHLLVNMYNSNIVFDEYHEFKMKEGIFAAFISLMHIRGYYSKDARTMLLSATESNFDCLWGRNIDGEEIVNYIPNVNMLYGDTKVTIHYHELNDINELNIPEGGDKFVICHSVPDSQIVAKNHAQYPMTVIHRRFPQKRLDELENQVISQHGDFDIKNEEDRKAFLQKREMVVGTSLIGTGLDISTKECYHFPVSPESTIQICCGRTSRFGEYEEIDYHVCRIKGGDSPIVKDNYSVKLNNMWINLLKDHDGETITKATLYGWYENFKEVHKKEIRKHYIDFFNKSSQALTHIEPYSHKADEGENEDNESMLSDGFTYRGETNNIYVTARNKSNGEWSDIIPVDLSLMLSSNRPEIHNRGDVEPLIKNGIYPKYDYPNKDIIKNGYKFTDYNIKQFEKMSKSPKWPAPLFCYSYDEKLGLIHKSDI